MSQENIDIVHRGLGHAWIGARGGRPYKQEVASSSLAPPIREEIERGEKRCR
jgi:hypothetical protein